MSNKHQKKLKPSNPQMPTLKPIFSFLLILSLNTLSLSLNQKPTTPPPPPPATVLKHLLRPSSQSPHFSSRASSFLNPSCHPQFFMTWISPTTNSFRFRQLFSIQSIFTSHPNACLLIASTSLDSPQGRLLLHPFTSAGFRVAAFSPHYQFLFNNTPAYAWFTSLTLGEVNPGRVPIGQNLSNLLRLALLYKYGGVYVDTDVLLLKSLLNFKNVIGAQAVHPRTGSWSRLNNAVLVFERNHPLLYQFMEEFAACFDGDRWGHNGPYLVSRVVERVVHRPPGFEFRVLNMSAFYPVDWTRVDRLFSEVGDTKWVEREVSWIRKESFAVHLWNRQTWSLKVEEGSVLARIMADCCLFCNSSTT